MKVIVSEAALQFCKLCDWAYESWCIHRYLFDENPDKEGTIAKAALFTNRLSIITQEYCLQQITKLHDPIEMGGNINLTIDYMIKIGDWTKEEKDKITKVYFRLNKLYTKIKMARNKVLAHHDLETIVNNEVLGAFPKNADEQYFKDLQKLVNIIHSKWIDGPYQFNHFAETDVEEFLDLMKNA